MKSLESMSGFLPEGSSGGKSKEDGEVKLTEPEAEALLSNLLEDPENEFLTEIPKNRTKIDDAPTGVEALAIARELIARRIETTMNLNVVSEIEGVEIHNISYTGLKENLDSIVRNAREIGRGGDGFVVIDKSEIRDLPPEICYKFAIAEQTPRGRNSTSRELEIQEQFYTSAEAFNGCKIGVPVPFYSVELGEKKVIAMEKLRAKSVDDILRGKGRLPSWFDLDTFLDELKAMLDHFHEEGLYHRDMHTGNVMISQAEDLRDHEKIGYVIDFGLSERDSSGLEPYKKESAGETFTYSDDYGIINLVRSQIGSYQKRA